MVEKFQMQKNFSEEEAKNLLEQITPNKDCLYIIQPFGLADILCSGGLSYAAQARKNKSATVLILNETAKNFGIAYENVALVSYKSPQILLAITNYLEKNEIYEGDNFIYGYLNPTKPENFTVAEGLNFIDYYRKKVLDIPLDTPLHLPIVKPLSDNEIESLNRRYTFDKNRTIILSITIDPKNETAFKFWENIVNRLKEKNYIVYSCIEKFSDQFIANTRPILASLSEISYIAENVKCFIGANAGLFAFLAMTSTAKIVFVNQFPAWIWDTAKIFPNSRCKTFYIAHDLLKNFIAHWKKEGFTMQVKLSHPKISDKIFYSYDDVFENILNAVEKI